jgi:rubrerythrin
MIKLSYEQLHNFEFIRAIQKLSQTPMNVKVAYNIKKLTDRLQSALNQAKKEYKDMLETHAQKDEKGEFLRPENDPTGFVPILPEEFAKAQREFSAKEAVIDRPKLMVHDLVDVKLSASELSTLDPLLTDLEVVAGQEASA